jgi:hypothetical protein
VAAITEFFNPALWREWLSAGVDQLGYTAFWFAVGQIIFINALLSGRNGGGAWSSAPDWPRSCAFFLR